MTDALRIVSLDWLSGLRFRGGAPGGPLTLIDADNAEAPGPMQALLLAAAACSGADVVSILQKGRVQLRRYHLEVTGLRAEEHPRRYLKIHFVMTLAGEGLDEAKARRAIDLSLQKYCSVLHTLRADIPVSYDLVLEP
jgi:putative redox protein